MASKLLEGGIQWFWAAVDKDAAVAFPLDNEGCLQWNDDCWLHQEPELEPKDLIPTRPLLSNRFAQGPSHMRCISANAQGLAGKYRYLEEQLQSGYNVAMFQEAKGHTGLTESGAFLRYASESGGIWGCEIWVNKMLGLGTTSHRPIPVSPVDISVILDAPRILALTINGPTTRILLVSAHCPHKQRPPSERDGFFKHLDSISPAFSDYALVVIGIDLNGRMPTNYENVTGSNAEDIPDELGAQFAAWLASQALVVPSTFEATHVGRNHTWQHTTGATSRIDYLCVGGYGRACADASWVDLQVDLANRQEDHSPVALSIFWHQDKAGPPTAIRRKRFDRAKMMSNEGRRILKTALQNIPPIDWASHPDAHCRQVEQCVQEILDDNFIAPVNGPRSEYIQPRTWELRQSRLALKRRVAMTPAERQWISVQAALQWWTRGNKCLLQWWQKRSLLYDVFAAALSFSGSKLKAALRADKNSYLARLAQPNGSGNAANVLAALKRAGIGKRNRGAFGRPLPSLADPADKGRTQREVLDDIWTGHFGAQEHGEATPTEVFLQEAAIFRLPHVDYELDYDLIPDLTEVEELCRGVAAGKASGIDNVPAELFRAAPQEAARLYQPLYAKSILACTQPVQWRGGLLQEAFKGSGLPSALDSYRSLFISSIPGKILHKHLRSRMGDLLEKQLGPLHCGARPGAPVTLAAASIAFLQRICQQKQWSMACLFLDARAAYYKVLREVAMGQLNSDAWTVKVFQHFGLPPEALGDLTQTVQQGGMLADGQMSGHLRRLVQDMYVQSWFVTPYGSGARICRTHTGSRPGETWADVVFAFVMHRILCRVREALDAEGALFRLSHDGNASPWPEQEASGEAEFLSAVWADDAAFPMADNDAEATIRRARAVVGTVLTVCRHHGIEANLKPGKTSLLVKLRGRGSQRAAREAFPSKASHLEELDLPRTFSIYMAGLQDTERLPRVPFVVVARRTFTATADSWCTSALLRHVWISCKQPGEQLNVLNQALAARNGDGDNNMNSMQLLQELQSQKSYRGLLRALQRKASLTKSAVTSG